MTLFGTIQIANNALIASSIGLQVAGNNISNASTQGYLRQEAVFTAGPTQRFGGLNLGMGVRIQGIIQQVDLYLEERFRSAISDVANSEQQEDVYLKLEAVLGELDETDLSSSLTGFFSSLNDILNQPESVSVRNLAVLKGSTLATDIRRFATRVREIRDGVNDRLVGMADEINALVDEIARLNVEIVALESGTVSGSDAVGLRDTRQRALEKLAEIIDIRSVEQEDGSITVLSSGDYIVSQGTSRHVRVESSTDRGTLVGEIRLVDSDIPLPASGGGMEGLQTARDTILGGVIDDFDEFVQTLIFEFNKAYSKGQGLTGFDRVVSESSINDANAALDQAGLTFSPQNGSFRVLVRNKETGLTKTTDIVVKLTGLEDDTTLQDLATRIDEIDGISALVTANGQLQITSDSRQLEFSFSDDTSGTLAALGINTFFTGTDALGIGVKSDLRQDASKFAASTGGIGVDSNNVADLAAFQDTPLETQNRETLASLYHGFTASITQGSAVARAVADGFRAFHRTLEGEKLGVSGVSIDDEAIRIIQYQRMYQASARVISTIDQLLETLINL